MDYIESIFWFILGSYSIYSGMAVQLGFWNSTAGQAVVRRIARNAVGFAEARWRFTQASVLLHGLLELNRHGTGLFFGIDF